MKKIEEKRGILASSSFKKRSFQLNSCQMKTIFTPYVLIGLSNMKTLFGSSSVQRDSLIFSDPKKRILKRTGYPVSESFSNEGKEADSDKNYRRMLEMCFSNDDKIASYAIKLTEDFNLPDVDRVAMIHHALKLTDRLNNPKYEFISNTEKYKRHFRNALGQIKDSPALSALRVTPLIQDDTLRMSVFQTIFHNPYLAPYLYSHSALLFDTIAGKPDLEHRLLELLIEEVPQSKHRLLTERALRTAIDILHDSSLDKSEKKEIVNRLIEKLEAMSSFWRPDLKFELKSLKKFQEKLNSEKPN